MHHFGGQVFGLNDLGGGHHRQPVADVLELPHISRELECRQTGLSRVRYAFGLHTQLLRALLQKVARQHRDVFHPFAQCGQAQANDVQAVEQVFTEGAIFDAQLQVLVGGGDDAHIGLDGAVPPHPVKTAIAQHPQQAGLQIKRHVTDLVQEQGAAFGLLKAAAAHALCAGKRTAFVAKQLALEQVFGNGRSIDRHKWPLGAR